MKKYIPAMKFLFSCCLLILVFSISVFAKSATVHITVKNFSGRIWVYDPGLRYDLTKSNVTELHLDAHQSASYTVIIDKPTSLVLSYGDFSYNLFLSPGDELFLMADFAQKNNKMKVTGKGSNNNQPEISALLNMNTQAFKEDSTPYRVIAAINKQYMLNKAMLANYIKVNKPSAACVKNAMMNLQYFAPLFFYESNHSNIYGKPKQQRPKWKKIQDSLFSTAKLNNSDALTAYNYVQLINHFVIMESGDLRMEYVTDPALFFRKWFHTDTTRGNKLFSYAPIGILNQKVIDKYFTGKGAEFAYSQAIKFQFLNEKNYPSAVLLFNHFKKNYPASAYIKGFSGPIAGVVNKQKQAISSKTIFVKDNGTKLNTFKDVLALTKGKTVLVDMWGTWCGPCREEIEKHAKQLRDHFKGKGVVFLYIDNFDVGKEKEWKKQIAYFQIEGEHILANPKLTADIMEKVKSTGYPTYIIVKKDGSYKQTTARYPVNLQAMIKEIETAAL